MASRRTNWRLHGLRLLGVAALLGGLAAIELLRTKPARSIRFTNWELSGSSPQQRGAALFSFGDFGALDLDTLATSALPWPLLASALALHAAGGDPGAVQWASVERTFKQFGFLYPVRISSLGKVNPIRGLPLGLSVGTVTRLMPPLKINVLNVGCSACHSGPSYRGDGSADPTSAVTGMPNTSIDLEAFSSTSYAALKRSLDDEPALLAAVARLFPKMGFRERMSLRYIALPMARTEIEKRKQTFDRALPFPNGAPGLTNGVAALKHRLMVTRADVFQEGAGFVSIPVIADRFWRSSLLVDGAYAPKGMPRFAAVTRAEMAARDAGELAAITSFFMVAIMGMTDKRVASAIPELKTVMEFLRALEPPRFPGPIDRALAAAGQAVFARDCAACHGTYDANLERPRLKIFPNWAGDVGTDRSRVEAFSTALETAVGQTLHGKTYLDVKNTNLTVAPLLSGLWTSAPYFVNGSVPTLRHLLEPATRPVRFTVGGHRLDFKRLGIAGVAGPDGRWTYPPGYTPFARPAVIDTTRPGFSNRGHEREVEGLTAAERDALIEYLKLL